MPCPKLLCFIGELSDTELVMVMDLLDTCHAPGDPGWHTNADECNTGQH